MYKVCIFLVSFYILYGILLDFSRSFAWKFHLLGLIFCSKKSIFYFSHTHRLMKKFLLLPISLLLLSACTFPGEKKVDESFSSLYNANIQASIAGYEELWTILGVNRHENIIGSINGAVSVPGILSGTISSEYTGLIDWRNSESFFRNIKVLFTSLVNSGSLSVDELGIVSHNADSYMSYKNIVDIGMIPEQTKEIIKKYENTWLNIAEKSPTDMSSEELMGYTIGKNIFMKSTSDIEKYATEYPLLKSTADLGMSGSLHMFSIEIDRANILALTKKLSLDLAGTGITDEYAKTVETNLAALSFSGVIGFDPKNPKISTIDANLSASGVLIAQIVTTKTENGGSIAINNSTNKTFITINYGNKEGKYAFDASFRQWDIEMGKANWYIELNNGKFHEFALDASAQGMTVSLKHTFEDGKFVGKLSAVVGTIEWAGTTKDSRLTALKVNGTAPFGSFSADLKPNESNMMIKGPVVVKSGNETIFSADLTLEVAREKLAFIIDIISEQFPVHLDMAITGKSTPSDKKIIPPVSTKGLQDLIKEIDALMPPESEFPISDVDSIPVPTGSMDTSTDSALIQ